MGFRDYSPGLNRFTSRDMYNGALADMRLGSDPFTGNRYAFTGGNPVSNVEIDGHIFPLILVAIPVVKVVAVAVVATVTTAVVVTAAQEAGTAIREAAEEAGQDDEPTPAPAPRGRPGGDTGGDTGSDDEEERCGSDPKSSRFQYDELDGEGRAQGATALICPSDLKASGTPRDDGGTVNVYGFPDPAQNKDLKDKVIFNRVHIVGDKMSGDWTERNLFTGFQRMNTSGMRRCEIKMERQLAAGNWVQYTGKVNYSHTEGIPDSITMSARTENGVLFDNVTVKNITE
ncbi:DNA/RNA non-specific endonuclease [Streptomyces sp. NPDC060366]